MGTTEARFSGPLISCLILRSKFFCLVLVHKKVWCSLFSLSIQTGVWAVTFRITLLTAKKEHKTWLEELHGSLSLVWVDIFLTFFSLLENSNKTHFCPKIKDNHFCPQFAFSSFLWTHFMDNSILWFIENYSITLSLYDTNHKARSSFSQILLHTKYNLLYY